GNVIGSPLPGGANVISGNQEEGIGIFSDANIIQGNLIGLGIDGVTPIPNDYSGIALESAFGNVIGGPGLGEGNVISGNAGSGIEIGGPEGSSADSTTIQGNLIGTDVFGTFAIGNNGTGINIRDGSFTTIGGIGAGEGNLIAFNAGDGVAIVFGTGNEISGNAIFDNDGRGIALAGFRGGAVTQNDPFDADNGPNGLQNYPVFDSFTNTGSDIALTGSLPSKPNADFRIEFFAISKAQIDPSRFGEGTVFLGSVNVTTDVSGNAPFTFSQAIDLPPDTFFTATATEIAAAQTSEFSLAIGPIGTFTWQGGVSTDWFEPANWSPNGVPGSFDTAIFNGGAPNDLELNQNTTVGTFQHTAGNFFGTGTLGVGDSLVWTGGSQMGPGLDLGFTAASTVGSGTGPLLWKSGDLANAGLLTINGLGLSFNAGNLIQDGDLFLDAGLTDTDGPATPAMAFNSGLITKRGAGAFGLQNIPLENNQLVIAAAGTLALGSYVTPGFSNGNELQLAGGDASATSGFDLGGGEINGSGQLIGDVNLSGGSISPGGSGGIGAISVTGNYSHGGQGRAGQLDIDVAGTNPGEFDTLTVTGTATLDGEIQVREIGGFALPLFARVDVLSAATVSGTFQVASLPPDAFVQYAPTSVAVQTPPLNSYTWTGIRSSDWMDGNNWSGGVVPGPNDRGILPGTALPNQPSLGNDTAIGLFEQQGGSLSGPGSLTVNFEFLWTGGTQSGAGSTVIPEGSSFIINGAATKSLDGRPLVIDPGAVGLISGTGGIAIGNDASVDISGDVLIVGDADFISGLGVGAIFVGAQGSLAKTAGGATDVASSIALQNAGDLRVDAGTLNFLGNISQSAGRTIIAAGATLGS
ncbi:MAG: right-handed parallel beta-helix repeat-containing protein, partial [Chthoniobacteraceae bacterium]